MGGAANVIPEDDKVFGDSPDLEEILERNLLVDEESRQDLRQVVRELRHSHNPDLSFFYLRPGPKGPPDLEALVTVMCDHVVHFALPHSKSKLEGKARDRAYRKAIHLFIKKLNSGDGGELLLFLLLDGWFGFPKMVAKLDLKTDAKPVGGADGLHATFSNGELELIFGEAKLHKKVKPALQDAFESVANHWKHVKQRRELQLYVDNPSYDDDELKRAVKEYIGGFAKTPAYTVAILIGFDWKEYRDLFDKGFAREIKEIEAAYSREAEDLADNTGEKLNLYFSPPRPRCRVMFVPFVSVAQFRQMLANELTGATKDPADTNGST
jgi:hypothetical protein